MAKKNAEMIVKLISVSGNELAGEIGFRAGSGDYKHGTQVNGLKFPKDDVYDMKFDLDADSTGLKLHFPVSPDKPDDAFWVGPADKCPVASAGNGNGAFEVKNVTKKQLKVDNINPHQENFMYMLRFRSEGDSTKWYYLDPVVENGGGGKPDLHGRLRRLLAHLLAAIGLARLANWLLR